MISCCAALEFQNLTPFRGNEMEMAAQLMQYGPLSVLILADGLQFYHAGVWTGVLSSPGRCGVSSHGGWSWIDRHSLKDKFTVYLYIRIIRIHMWVCLKMGYTSNYSHLVGIMISKTIGFFGVHNIFRQTHVSIMVGTIHDGGMTIRPIDHGRWLAWLQAWPLGGHPWLGPCCSGGGFWQGDWDAEHHRNRDIWRTKHQNRKDI